MKFRKVKSIIILVVLIITVGIPVVADGTRTFSVEHSDADLKLWGRTSLTSHLFNSSLVYYVHLMGDDLDLTDSHSTYGYFYVTKKGKTDKKINHKLYDHGNGSKSGETYISTTSKITPKAITVYYGINGDKSTEGYYDLK